MHLPIPRPLSIRILRYQVLCNCRAQGGREALGETGLEAGDFGFVGEEVVAGEFEEGVCYLEH